MLVRAAAEYVGLRPEAEHDDSGLIYGGDVRVGLVRWLKQRFADPKAGYHYAWFAGFYLAGWNIQEIATGHGTVWSVVGIGLGIVIMAFGIWTLHRHGGELAARYPDDPPD